MDKWITSKESKWIEKWNNFVLNDENSSSLQLTNRISSYEKYGMDWELLLKISQTNEIIIGSANIIVKFSVFKLYICPYGPTINAQITISDSLKNEFFEKFIDRSKELNAFVTQISLNLRLIGKLSVKFIEGKIFEKITTARYANLIVLKSKNIIKDDEDIIKNFSPKGRRDVRASYRRDLELRIPKSNEEIQEAYSCIDNNANVKGYNVRRWEEIANMIIEGFSNKSLFLLTAWYENELQGTIMLERSANKLHYTMGGVKRHKPDLLTGYFLQFEAIKLAKSLNLDYYDISYGGPKEVQRFKAMFNPQLEENCKTYYHINSKYKFLLYQFLYKNLKIFVPYLISIKRKLSK